MAESDCLFCRIVAGEVPADVVARTERSLAFRDIEPQAPTHVLVIPTEHRADVAELAGDPEALADLIGLAAQVARQEDLQGYRLVFNTGRAGGQLVLHAHGHVLGGRRMGWPPG